MKHNKIKRNLLLVLALIAIIVTSCGKTGNDNITTKPEGSKEGKQITVAYTVQTLNNPYFTTLTESFENSCKKNGIKAIIGNGDQDAAKQISQIENFITQKVDAIVIAPTDDKALESAVKQAKDAGIPVICTNQNVEGSDAFITVPEYEYGESIGKVAADWINQHFKDSVDVLVLDYPEIQSIIARGDGIREAIKKNSKQANIVASISANTPEKGIKAMETVLQQHPNVQVVVGVNDAGVLGAYEAVKAANKQTENFFMGGLDATDQALELISKGTIFRATVDINPKGTGDLIVKTVKEVIEKGPIKETVNIEMIPITKDNVKDFLSK